MRNPFFFPSSAQRHGGEAGIKIRVCVCALGNGLIHSANTSTHKVTAKKDTRPGGATRRVIELPGESISCLTLRNEKSMLSHYPRNSSAAGRLSARRAGDGGRKDGAGSVGKAVTPLPVSLGRHRVICLTISLGVQRYNRFTVRFVPRLHWTAKISPNGPQVPYSRC